MCIRDRDYTPGAFGNSNRENFVPRNLMPMGLGTRAHELALFVVLESPLQMVSDYPEHYAGQHDFEFIRQVPTTWDEVRVLDGLPMQNITLARRSGADWYVGSLTNWDARTVQVPLSFLADGKYVAEIYADAADAGTNAVSYTHLPRISRIPFVSTASEGRSALSDFLSELKRRVLVYDGAMGTSVQKHNLTPEDFWGKEGCNELLVLSRPDVIRSVHASFLDVGCDVVETDSFGSTSIVLAEYDLQDRTRELNIAAARLARSVADEYSTLSLIHI